MAVINRVLDPEPVETLDAYVAIGGGSGLDAARRLDGVGIIEEVAASGLRGRGGGGFPTGTKWASIAAGRTAQAPAVLVNAAEGEPGSFKDRTLLRRNPYRILEGALIAASAVGAERIVVGLKRSFARERRRVAYAIAELRDAGWLDDVDVRVVLGPGEYLFGEETGLLEVIEGRQPFPRIAPPYRRGVDATAADDDEEPWDTDEGLVLANNVETFANVPGIVMQGASWFRSLGTEQSPGSIVCTVSGDSARDAVAEVALGTPVGEIIEEIGGGARPGQRLVAALSGVANAFLPASMFETPASYEALAAAGSGLGAAGFIVFDDSTDLVAVAHGVARFLSVESCGQCEPCKRDGLAIEAELDALQRSTCEADVLARLEDRLGTITDGARCNLATQQQVVTRSLLRLFPDVVEAHVHGSTGSATSVLIAPMVDIEDGQAFLEASQATKQPDWTHASEDSGRWPAAYLGDTPVHISAHAAPTEAAAPEPAPSAEPAPEAVAGPILDADGRPVEINVADQLELAHAELVEALLHTASPRPGSAEQQRAIDAFEARLRAHMEVTTRVLYPMVRRVGDDAGERAAERGEHLERATARVLHDLRSSSSDRTLSDLATDLDDLILDEDRRIIPLLEEQLDDADLDELGRAIHEARLV
ncbi:MAG: NADH-ubiquinone oxidoreductase-F iron-sulfur binding region domain-containing protein [Acidimicrobiia bacterium]